MDGSDRIFAAGENLNQSTGFPTYAVVRRSLDHGATWQTIDTSSGWYRVKGMAVSRGGVIVIVGSARTNLAAYSWRTRLSRDGGVSWTTVDEPVYSEHTEAAAAAIGPDDAIYVAGFDLSNWIVRRSSDLGNTWTEVAKVPNVDGVVGMKLTPDGMILAGGDRYSRWQVAQSTNHLADWFWADDWFPDASPGNYHARAIGQDNYGNLIVVGGSPGGDSAALNWVIRRSTNGGASWTIADQLQFPLVNNTQYGWGATAVVTDVGGRMWATGADQAGIQTRVSSNNGVSWTDSDTFRYANKTTLSARAEGIASDSLGNVFVIGWINPNSPERPRWILRKLDGPPRLSSLHLAGQIRFSWPTNASGFVLQSATTLANGGNWQDSSLTPTEINGQNVITVDATNAAGFFRLRQP